jgi:hypothetical protein
MTAILNGLRDFTLSSQELQRRREIKTLLGTCKLVAIATAAFFTALFIFHPGFFTFLLAGVVSVAAHEGYRVCDNFLEILNNAVLEARVRNSEQAMRDQICKNTLILNVITP